MTGTVSELFQNCDSWGAKEWFERLVDAIKRQDECVLAKDEIGFETYKHIAASSAMRLVREHAGEVLSALTASASEPAKPEVWQWREVRSNRHSPDGWRAGAWRDGRIPSTARATDFVRFEERALYASPVPASEPEPVASLDERMKAAGMIPLSELLAGNTPLRRWMAHTGVRDMGSFENWLASKHREFLSMRVAYELGDKDQTDELYEWVFAHAAVFGEVAANFRQAKECTNPVPAPDGAVEAAKALAKQLSAVIHRLNGQAYSSTLSALNALTAALETPWQKPGRAAQAQAGEKPDFPADEQSGETSHGALSHPADGWREPDAFPVATLDHLSDGAAAVIKERLRQVYGEGWTPEHDDEHRRGEMAAAAANYALYHTEFGHDLPNHIWPWSPAWWKPGDRRRDLVKAGALIIAEIERLDRAAAPLDAKAERE